MLIFFASVKIESQLAPLNIFAGKQGGVSKLQLEKLNNLAKKGRGNG